MLTRSKPSELAHAFFNAVIVIVMVEYSFVYYSIYRWMGKR